jgi:ribokinase
VLFVGALGDDFYGLSRKADLEFERIDLTLSTTLHGVASGVALILVDAQGENAIGVSPGANGRLQPDHVARIPLEILSAGTILVAGWEIPTPTLRAGLERARQGGATTLFNPAPVGSIDPQDDWLSLVDILVLNEHELAELSGEATLVAHQAIEHIRRLHARGVMHVVVTLGREGYLLSQRGEVEAFPAFAVDAVDTVGAGDTFVGALASRLAENHTLKDAARWASAAAALAVTRPGAQAAIPCRADVDLFLARSSP